MFANVRSFLTKSVALLAVVVGLGVGSYGVASASTGYSTAPHVVATAPAAPPGAGE
jgi:hypothetical protein